MSLFNNSNNNEIDNSTISTVAGDQYIAENITVIHQDSRKRGRQAFIDDINRSLFIETLKLLQDVDNSSSWSKTMEQPSKKSRVGDGGLAGAVTAGAPESVYNFIGGDSYTAGTLQIIQNS
ncbi:hypothetical protein H0H92_013120, partial [Tricholoma furcatifolium]